MFILTQIIAIVLAFIAMCNVQVVISYIYTETMHSTLYEYLMLKVSAIQRIGVNTVQSLIPRRATAFCSILECLATRMLPKVLFLTSALRGLLSGQNFKKHLLLLLIFSIVASLQILRSYLAIRVNHLYEISNAKRIEIIEKYETIISYKLLDSELVEYNTLLENFSFLKQIYTCSYHLIFLFLGLSLIIFFSSILNSSVDKGNLVNLIMLNEKFKDYMNCFSKDLDRLIQDYTIYSYSGYSKNDIESKESNIDIVEFKDHIKVESLKITARDQVVLNNINFTINKNEKVAIFGSNGSGKSLLVEVLAGLGDYKSSVKIDGFDMCKISRQALNSMISYVPQCTTVLNTTIKKNLSIGIPTIENEDLINICKKFKSHSLFTKLGYEKSIGASGKFLSGGQRQRIILLRAMLKKSKILILDDAFLGVDQKTEEHFIKTLAKEEQTLIFSTKNPDILRYFDEIIFINNGCAIKASFSKLMEKSPEFKSLYDIKIRAVDFYSSTVPIEATKTCVH
ncbi:ABC transporter [Glugoides intestinalis]